MLRQIRHLLMYASGIGYLLSTILHVILLFRITNPPDVLVIVTLGGIVVILLVYPIAAGFKIRFSRIMFGAWVSSSNCPTWLRTAYYCNLAYLLVLLVVEGMGRFSVVQFRLTNLLLPSAAMFIYMNVFLGCYVLNSTDSK